MTAAMCTDKATTLLGLGLPAYCVGLPADGIDRCQGRVLISQPSKMHSQSRMSQTTAMQYLTALSQPQRPNDWQATTLASRY